MSDQTMVPHSVMVSQIDAAVLAEREACAKIVQDLEMNLYEEFEDFRVRLVGAIRARGSK